MTMKRVLKTSAAVALLAGVEATFPAYAALDELVVTARKREESLQEVPLSITAFNVQGLRDRNIQSAYDVANFTPNFQFTRNLGRRLDAPNVRGQFSPLLGQSNASFYIDGVAITGGAASVTIDNLERVEILRGPQAALFGRATFAGAVNFITRKPSDEFEGEVNLKLGEYEDYKASVWASGPIVEDKVYFVATANWEHFGGEWNNQINPDDVNFLDPVWPDGPPPSAVTADRSDLGGEETLDFSGKLTLRPTDDLELNFKGQYTETDDDHFVSYLVPTDQLNCFLPGDPGAAAETEGWFCGELEADGLNSQLNIQNLKEGVTTFFGEAAPAEFIGGRRRIRRYMAEGIYDVAGSDWQLLGRGTYDISDESFFRDLDRTPGLGPISTGLFESNEPSTVKNWTYEARLSSPEDNRVRGFLGAYSFRSTNERGQRDFTGFSNIMLEVAGRSRIKNKALFGSVEFDVTDELTFAYDARYAEDKITQEVTAEDALADPTSVKFAQETFYSYTPRYTLTYQPNDDVTMYGLAAKGNKPGGFNFAFFDSDVIPSETAAALSDGRAVVDEEEAWTYEIGAKTAWMDGDLILNAAVYYIDWTNQAINQTFDIATVGGPQPNSIIVNAGKSEVIGVELEMFWDVTENITMSASYGLADTELKEFNDGDIAMLTGVDDPFLLDGGNAKGQEAPRVPKHSANFAATYRNVLTGDLDWFMRTDLNYESKRWVTAANLAHTGDTYVWNGRVGVDHENWTVSAFVDNILDDDSPVQIQDFPNFNEELSNGSLPTSFQIIPRRSRRVGVTAQYRF